MKLPRALRDQMSSARGSLDHALRVGRSNYVRSYVEDQLRGCLFVLETTAAAIREELSTSPGAGVSHCPAPGEHHGEGGNHQPPTAEPGAAP